MSTKSKLIVKNSLEESDEYVFVGAQLDKPNESSKTIVHHFQMEDFLRLKKLEKEIDEEYLKSIYNFKGSKLDLWEKILISFLK